MDTWESFFREKSRRRFRPQTFAMAGKAAIVALLLADLAVVAAMFLR